MDRQGRQHFNFPQSIWLDASVQMAYTGVYSTALKTLAANLLWLVTAQSSYRAMGARNSRPVLSLAPSFAKECLLTAPGGAWVLPRVTINAWLDSKQRKRRRDVSQ
jgi:hypothetical protein